MDRNTVAIFHMPWQQTYDLEGVGLFAKVVNKFKKAVYSKANPRSEEYMKKLCAEVYPNAEIFNFSNRNWGDAAGKSDVIVLLYPDTIGQGFSVVEKAMKKASPSWAELRVLNGRKRNFLLNCSTRWSLKMRRFFEKTMLIELGIMVLFVVVTPVFLVVDLVRGRV